VIGRSLRLACAETAEITAQAVLKVLNRQKGGPAREAYSTGWTGAAAGGRDLEILFPLDIDINHQKKAVERLAKSLRAERSPGQGGSTGAPNLAGRAICIQRTWASPFLR
jgi:hypothetical protein